MESHCRVSIGTFQSSLLVVLSPRVISGCQRPLGRSSEPKLLSTAPYVTRGQRRQPINPRYGDPDDRVCVPRACPGTLWGPRTPPTVKEFAVKGV